MRAVLRLDAVALRWNRMDKLLVAYLIVGSFAYVLLRQTSTAFVNRLGIFSESFLAYFLIRYYVKSVTQVVLFTRVLAYACLVIAVFMVIEHLIQFNVFSILGGVSEIPNIREGKIRAQGAFSHAILAGTFGASFLPLFWSLWYSDSTVDRRTAVIGGISAIVITVTSSSSGPIMTLLASILAISIWSLRKYTKMLWRGFILLLLFLHLVMKDPVWSLIARIDITGGSTGDHRSRLIDQAIRHFSEWALLGVRTTGHWGWGLNDVTNMYVLQAVEGGLGQLLLFVFLLSAAFRSVNTAMVRAENDKGLEKLFWAWGSVLFAHSVSFIGVSYFGQMFYLFFLTLGVIACLPDLSSSFTHVLSKNESDEKMKITSIERSSI